MKMMIARANPANVMMMAMMLMGIGFTAVDLAFVLSSVSTQAFNVNV
jgi:hypothetical protein